MNATCTCGHALGDHSTGRQSLAGSLQGGHRLGRCLIAGCDCRQYVQTNGTAP